MDIIRENTTLEKAVVIGVFLAVAAVLFFAFVGVYQMAFGIPERASIEQRAEVGQARAMELEKVVEGYQSALKWENLFLIVADPNSVMDFTALEEYIQDRRDFYAVKQ